LDALKSSHSVHAEVNLPKQRFEIFDEICYLKGASIIRMLYTFIGEEEFRQGINIYLTKYKYRNASGDDLWKAFEEASEKPIGSIINTWIKQSGFPLVRVSIEEINGAQVLNLSQERFQANSSHKQAGKNKGSQWMIPMTVCSKSSPTEMIADFLMEERSVTLLLPEMEVVVEEEDDEWVKVSLFTFSSVLTYSS
jgi:puromycin-sensitive aminopeptidase